jgi:multidrug efflux pump subunit AcrB
MVRWSVTSLTRGVHKAMFLTKLKAGAIAVLAICTIASPTALAIARAQADPDNRRPFVAAAAVAIASSQAPQGPAAGAAAKAEEPPDAGSDGVVQSKPRLFTPAGKLMYVNVYSTDNDVNQNSLHDFATVSILPKITRARGIGSATILGNGAFPMRAWLNPDRMRAYKLSSADVIKAISEQSLVVPLTRLGLATSISSHSTKASRSIEYLLSYAGPYKSASKYENIILRDNPEGEILRLKDVGEVEVGPRFFDVYSVVDGYASATIVFQQLPGWNAAMVSEAVKKDLEKIKAAAFPPGMNFEVIPVEDQDRIDAVIEAPPGATLEYTSAKCHELAAIAKGIDEITSVSSLAGYQIRTEGRGRNEGSCLIHLKDRPDRKLTSRQIIEKLEEECRTISNVKLELFEPPAVSVFVAAGGFSVRVLDKTNSYNDERLGRGPETFMDRLLKRKNQEGLFTFFARNYPQYELVINNDVAMQSGVSIANAMENLPIVVGGDVQSERKFRGLVEDLSHLLVKNDRGKMVPFGLFLQLKKKQG